MSWPAGTVFRIGVPGGISPGSHRLLFIPTLRVLQRLGLLPDNVDEISEMIDYMRALQKELAPEVPAQENRAKQLAQKLFNRIPVIWGSSGTTEVVAQRWKGQINENAKAPAYWNVLPELNHNEIVGFQFPRELLKKLHVVILRDERDHPRVHKRIEITKEIIRDAVDGCTEVWASVSELSRIFFLIYTGDYTSVYLAALYGVDRAVKVIDYLKRSCGTIKFCRLPHPHEIQ